MLARKTEEWNEIWKVTIKKVTHVPSTARYSVQELETLKGNFEEAKSLQMRKLYRIKKLLKVHKNNTIMH